jgi:hypothetical protein
MELKPKPSFSSKRKRKRGCVCLHFAQHSRGDGLKQRYEQTDRQTGKATKSRGRPAAQRYSTPAYQPACLPTVPCLRMDYRAVTKYVPFWVPGSAFRDNLQPCLGFLGMVDLDFGRGFNEMSASRMEGEQNRTPQETTIEAHCLPSTATERSHLS